MTTPAIANADPVIRIRSLWIQYDGLKRNLTRLGVTMLKTQHDPKEIDDLCVEMIDAMLGLRAAYRESLAPKRPRKEWP